MHPFRCRLVRSSLCALLLLAAAAPAMAGRERAPAFDPSAPSYVDLGRVVVAYRKTSGFARHQQTLRDQSRKFADEMRALVELRYLPEAERKEAMDLQAKPTRNARETARLDTLKKKSETLDDERAQLSQKMNPTDTDVKRIGELTQMRQQAYLMLAKEESDRRDRLRDMDQAAMEQIQGELLKIVEKVAKDKKIPYVYNQPAILYGGNDLTDEVIKRLPK